MNKTLLTGRVAQAATFASLSETQDVVNFTLVTSDSYKDKEGNWKENTQFHRCTRYTKKGSGQQLAEMIGKGRALEVEGELRTSKPRAGKNRAGEEKMFVNKNVIVDNIVFGAKGKEESDA
jgi:single-strand DNA-binding protein